ncbi:MAG: hypothetical protein DWQ37_10895 [Planctomycetota bacterium]|nr:MAG: hypothetical protein DWQ37_10895 [Planctomycetota bacterium]
MIRRSITCALAVLLACCHAARGGEIGGLVDFDLLGFSGRHAARGWDVWVGAIFLDRSNPGATPLVSVDGGPELLDASALNFSTQGGWDINAIRYGKSVDLEFRYFHVNHITAEQTLLPTGDITIDLRDPLPISTSQLDVYDVTGLQSVELNLRTGKHANFALLAGFRHLTLRDTISFRGDDELALGDFNLNLSALNRLYGGQIGVDCLLSAGSFFGAGRFELKTALKAGVYGNTGSAGVSLGQMSSLDDATTVQRQSTAFVGDITISGLYYINDTWALRGGYQLLWISGVALAPDQAQHFTVTGDPQPYSADVSGNVFFNGALVSVQASW